MFALSNIVIDLEPIVWYLFTGDPAHRYLHTYLGAGLLAVVCALLGRRLCEKLLVFWNSRLDHAQTSWLAVETKIPVRMALVSAFLGTWSHIFLDSVMHADIRPFWPLSGENGLRGLWPLDFLHLWCVMLGIWGLLRLLTARWDVVRQDVLEGRSQPFRAARTAERLTRATVGVIRTAIGGLCTMGFIMMPVEPEIRGWLDSLSFDAEANVREYFSSGSFGEPFIGQANYLLMTSEKNGRRIFHGIGYA